jgi:hypothetical protein
MGFMIKGVEKFWVVSLGSATANAVDSYIKV